MRHAATRPPSHTSDSPSESSDESAGLSDDDIFHILQTNRRRESIRYLLEQDGPVKMRDVAEYVAARENETTVSELTSAQRQRVYIPLYQSHLPKLDKKGLIEYNKSRGIVRPTERLRIFEPYLGNQSDAATDPSDADTDADADVDADPTANDYHVTAIGASASLLVATASGLLSISGLILAAIITTLFTLATVATTLPRRTSTNAGEPKSVN